jgi:histidinol phosphate phosphatase HisJ family
MYRNLYDSHVHSCNSHDGSDEVGAICAAALERGLRGVAFTDHCDADAGLEACLKVKRRLFADVAKAREVYGDRLEIAMGIELGEPHHDVALSRALLDDPGLDFVIGSLHRLRGEPDFYFVDYAAVDLDSLLLRYYEELLELAACGCYDVVGHINYQLRYMRARERFRPADYYDALRGVLREVAAAGKGIEINTSGLRRGEVGLLPAPEVVRMFREAGGEIVTAGSDSHDLGSVGAGIPQAMDCMRAAGFEQTAFFRGRAARFLELR